MDTLLKEERQKLILDALQESNRVTVPELSARFGTSEVTIRRDLADLAAEGKLQRAHRGALRLVPAPPEPPVLQRLSLTQAEKEQIGRAAARLVEEGDSIFIGSGSTTAAFARCLSGLRRLTVVTNALNVAVELAAVPGEWTVVVTGGVVRPAELSLLGHLAEQSLGEVRVSKIFMGMQAISLDGGLTSDHMPEVMTSRRVFEMAPELIVLADHSKLGKTAAAFIAPLERVSSLVTDSGADPAFLAQARARGLRVIVASL
jgi:DeoR/GlpR family transcriptional regulator of sugar metabolism